MIALADSRGDAVARRGRRTKLTDATQKVIVDSIAAGVPQKYAAQRAGIGERTLAGWLAAGRKATKGPFLQFLQAVKKAEADAIARNVAIVQKAAGKSWQAAAWWLERRHHEDFGRKDRTIIQPERRVKLGPDVRKRLDEIDSPGPGQPGEAGRTGAEVVADSASPAACEPKSP
jgi:transposase